VKLDDNVGLIEKELGKLWQIKDLGLNNVEKKHASALCSAINKMKNLEKLHIAAEYEKAFYASEALLAREVTYVARVGSRSRPSC
jgi:hypothetical protein